MFAALAAQGAALIAAAGVAATSAAALLQRKSLSTPSPRPLRCVALPPPRVQTARKRPGVLDLLRHPWLQMHMRRPSVPARVVPGLDMEVLETVPLGLEQHRPSMHGANTARALALGGLQEEAGSGATGRSSPVPAATVRPATPPAAAALPAVAAVPAAASAKAAGTAGPAAGVGDQQQRSRPTTPKLLQQQQHAAPPALSVHILPEVAAAAPATVAAAAAKAAVPQDYQGSFMVGERGGRAQPAASAQRCTAFAALPSVGQLVVLSQPLRFLRPLCRTCTRAWRRRPRPSRPTPRRASRPAAAAAAARARARPQRSPRWALPAPSAPPPSAASSRSRLCTPTRCLPSRRPRGCTARRAGAVRPAAARRLRPARRGRLGRAPAGRQLGALRPARLQRLP